MAVEEAKHMSIERKAYRHSSFVTLTQTHTGEQIQSVKKTNYKKVSLLTWIMD